MADPRTLRRFEPRIGPAPEVERPRGEEIIGIIPAPGWRVRYVSSRESGGVDHWTVPVACWALLRRFGRTVVVGLVAIEDELVPARQGPGDGFSCYEHQDDEE